MTYRITHLRVELLWRFLSIFCKHVSCFVCLRQNLNILIVLQNKSFDSCVNSIETMLPCTKPIEKNCKAIHLGRPRGTQGKPPLRHAQWYMPVGEHLVLKQVKWGKGGCLLLWLDLSSTQKQESDVLQHQAASLCSIFWNQLPLKTRPLVPLSGQSSQSERCECAGHINQHIISYSSCIHQKYIFFSL